MKRLKLDGKGNYKVQTKKKGDYTMSMTIEKILKSAKVLEKTRPARKKGNLKRIQGAFADVGKKLKKEGKTSVDLVREIRETR